jgi:hypothetical protein
MADVTQAQIANEMGINRQRIAHVERTVRVTPVFATRYLTALERLRLE